MRVLVACEFSGTVRDAFIARGHDAMSCDLMASEKEGPHYQGDIRDVLYAGWDLMIAHPPCTYLSSSGLHWNKNPKSIRYGGKQTEEALDFVQLLMAANIKHKAIENPQGCIGTRIRPADQYVQPYEFGHSASKKTGLWLHNPPILRTGRRVFGRHVEWPIGSGKMVERWDNQTDSGQNKLAPSANRWALRSITYQGIANAMADQWGGWDEL